MCCAMEFRSWCLDRYLASDFSLVSMDLCIWTMVVVIDTVFMLSPLVFCVFFLFSLCLFYSCFRITMIPLDFLILSLLSRRCFQLFFCAFSICFPFSPALHVSRCIACFMMTDDDHDCFLFLYR